MRRYFILFLTVFLFFSCSQKYFVKETTAENILINSENSSIDSLVQSLITPYRDSIEHDMSKLISYSESQLVRGKPESKLTNLVADIILNFGLDYCKNQAPTIHPVLSYVNYGGIRASLPEGKITVRHIFELMPFENEVVLLELTGESIQKMADRIAGRGGEGIAGMKMGIRGQKAVDILVAGKPLDLNATYWLVTNDYVASGGDQMTMFINPLKSVYTRNKIRDVMISALEKQYQLERKIIATEDGRIYHAE